MQGGGPRLWVAKASERGGVGQRGFATGRGCPVSVEKDTGASSGPSRSPGGSSSLALPGLLRVAP